MNTRQLPPVLALVAGFMTCVMSFVQRVDMTVFAKRFIVVTIIFFIIGVVLKIVIDINFKSIAEDEETEEGTEQNEDQNETQKEEKRAENNTKDSEINGSKKVDGEEEV